MGKLEKKVGRPVRYGAMQGGQLNIETKSFEIEDGRD